MDDKRRTKMSPAMPSMGWPLSNFMNSLTKKALLRDWRRRKFSSLITSTDVVFNYSPLVFPALTFRVMVSFNNNKTNKHKREKKKMKKCYLIFFFFCLLCVFCANSFRWWDSKWRMPAKNKKIPFLYVNSRQFFFAVVVM